MPLAWPATSTRPGGKALVAVARGVPVLDAADNLTGYDCAKWGCEEHILCTRGGRKIAKDFLAKFPIISVSNGS